MFASSLSSLQIHLRRCMTSVTRRLRLPLSGNRGKYSHQQDTTQGKNVTTKLADGCYKVADTRSITKSGTRNALLGLTAAYSQSDSNKLTIDSTLVKLEGKKSLRKSLNKASHDSEMSLALLW